MSIAHTSSAAQHVVMQDPAVALMATPVRDTALLLSLEEASLRPATLFPQHVLSG
jgi:hypothetical protein